MARRRRGRGEGGVYQRADGYWVGAVSGIDGTGRRRRVVVYGKTKGDALTNSRRCGRSAPMLSTTYAA